MLVTKIELDNNIEAACGKLLPHIHGNVIDRESVYESILDSIHDSVFSVDRNFRIITANKGFRERTLAITGIDLKPGDCIYCNGRNPQVVNPIIASIERAMSGEYLKMDFELEADGMVIYRESTFTPIRQGEEVKGVTIYSKDVSEAKIGKIKLEEQEVMFRTLLENSHDGIAMLSAGGRLKYISPSVGRILGYSFEEMCDIGSAALVHPDDLGAVLQFTENLVPRYGESGEIEYRMRSKAGLWRWVHCHYTNMLHEASIKAFVVNYEDITEERELVIELENSVHDLVEADERQSSIINSLRAHIALLNQDGTIIEVNEAWKQFADENQLVNSNYCIGDNYLEISERATCNGQVIGHEVATGIRDVLAGKLQEFSTEYTCHCTTEKRWFKVIVYPLYKQSRGGVVVYHVNITDRKLADLQIESHRRNRDALINTTSDLMWSFDADMLLVTANHSFVEKVKEISGIEVKLGDHVLPPSGFPEEEIAYWARNYQRVLAGEQFTDQVFRSEPVEYWSEISFHPIWENGKVTGAACYSRNITERKKSEQLILQHQQMLEDAESIAHFGSWECDLQSSDDLSENDLRWSKEVFRIFGYEPGEIEVSNDNFFKAVFQEDREPIKRAVQRAIEESTSYSYDHRILRPDGEVRWVQEEAKIILNPKTGKPLKMIGTVLDITERKSAEAKLLDAERNYREIFDKASDGIFVHDVETGNIVDANLMACEITGVTKEEIINGDNEQFLSGVPGYGMEDAVNYMQKAITEGPQLFEWYAKRKDGTLYWSEVSLTLAIIAGTQRILAFFREIDDRKEAEMKLRKSEESYRQIVETAQEGIWVLDENDITTYVNDKMSEILEYSREEMIGKSAYDFMDEERKATTKLQLKQRHEGQSINVDKPYLTKSGRLIWCNVSASPIFGEDGKYVGALGMVTDISKRKSMEESLRLSNERYELVTKATNDAIWDWNLVNDKVYWSEAYEKLFGYKKQEDDCSDEIWAKRIHPEDVHRIWSSVKESIHNPESHSWQNEYRYIKADGSIAYVHDRGYIIYNEKGMPTRMVGAMQDITAHKLADEALKKRSFDLNERVKELHCLYQLSMIVNDSNLSVNEILQHCVKIIPPAYQYPEITSARIILNGEEFCTDSFRETIWKQDAEIVVQEKRVGSIEVHYLEEKPKDFSGPFLEEEFALIKSISRNISTSIERKMAEESLLKSEANLRTIFDHADRAYVLLDKNFYILSFNSVANEWAKLIYKSDFQEGKSLLSYIEPDRIEAGQRILESVLKGRVDDHEMSHPMPDGSVKWFSVRRYPVRNKNGEILGICIATKDSTMRKNFEIERDRLTAEIVQRNKDLEQFAYIVSHNLRAPVANIIGFSDALLQMELEEAEKQEMLDGLSISIKRLDNTILDLNKILQVKKAVEVPKEIVSFSSLVKDVRLSIGIAFDKEKAVIIEDFTEVDELMTQKSYLHSIFYNLISNSLKYRRQDVFPVIQINSRRFENKIELSFSDNGLGIDLEKKNDQIFGLYKRFHPAVAEGKGMGLFMVKTQVENLGGKISVNSKVNAGTEFKIVFDY